MISAEGPPDSRLDAAPRPAAVLLLLYPDPTGGADTIVFTRRPEEMRHHPGQISLPGGSREPEDADAVATALREAQEELAIPPSAVQVIATLEPVFTVVSNYLITPVVGRAAARPAFVADPREVAEVIEVPLAGLQDPAIYRREPRDTPWGRHDIHYYQYGPYNIWGATARILQIFLANIANLGT